ncbi:hypothetical protein AB0M54_44975 [Actinoplanes sp. NPDC051470]|uniref:hypothetical protein n=1 Tax=Actinoplanes sp. NPDC051470 TaxID=3157224 RepID=UPI00344813AF
MSVPAAPLDVVAGCRLVLHGVAWTVEQVLVHHGRVLLRDEHGERRPASVRELVAAARPAVTPGPRAQRQPAGLDDLTSQAREQLLLRVAHLLEVETGFRGGEPHRPAPGEPRSRYDPAVTTLTQRRAAKIAELQAWSDDAAALLGLRQVSERTLRRWAAAFHRFGVIGCADGRLLRRGGDRPSITEPVREAIYAVRAETLHRSTVSMRARERLIHQYVRPW